MANWEGIEGVNRGCVLELYERYRRNPAAVDRATRELFARWTPPAEVDDTPEGAGLSLQKAVGAVNLAQSIRRYGHLAAQLDPLGARPVGDPSLQPETHGVTEDDLRRLPAG